MFIIAQVIGIVASIINICSIQLKNKKSILLFLIFSNLLFGINFLLLQAFSGTVVCIIVVLLTLISYAYEIKQKEFPKILVPIYIFIAIACGGVAYKGLIDILPIVCFILYVLIIIQKKEKNIRSMSLVSMILWLAYDFLVQAYTLAISDAFFMISNIIAIMRYDIKKNDKEK